MRGDELSLLLDYPFWASVLVAVIACVVLFLWDMYRDGVFSRNQPLVGFEDDRPEILKPEHDPQWQQWPAVRQAQTELTKRMAIKRHTTKGDAA